MLQQLFTFLPFTICLFWTLVYVLNLRHAHPAKRLLTCFMAITTTLFFCHAVFFSHELSVLPWANTIYAFCTLAVYPLYYLYIYRLTNSKPLLWYHGFVLLPATIMGLWAATNTLLHIEGSETTRLMTSKIVFVLQLFPVCIMGWQRLTRFDHQITEYLSNPEYVEVKQTRYTLVVFIVFSCLSAVFNIIGREHFDSDWIILPSSLFSMLIFAVGYVGHKQHFCADDLKREMEEVNDMLYTLSATKEDFYIAMSDQELIERLDCLMTEQKLYLSRTLKLSDLISLLHTNRTTLSRVINQQKQVSFTDYVGLYRVKYAKALLLDAQSPLSIEEIGEQSGFNSTASFFRMFRKFEGMTPKQWQKNKSLPYDLSSGMSPHSYCETNEE